MLEKKRYRLHLKSEPKSERRSELRKYLQEFSFCAKVRGHLTIGKSTALCEWRVTCRGVFPKAKLKSSRGQIEGKRIQRKYQG